MSSLTTLVRLIPFLASAGYFFWEYVDKQSDHSNYMIFKSLPTASLAFFVLTLNSNSSYSNRIFLALVFSTIGDAALCYPNYVSIGVGLFAIAQLIYINAFGFRQTRSDYGFLLLCIYAGACFYLHPHLMRVDANLGLGVEAYMALLFTMIWRAFSRFGILDSDNFPTLCGSLGAIFFGISDLVLFYDSSVKNVSNGNFIIMATYYAAQACFALTTLKYKIR